MTATDKKIQKTKLEAVAKLKDKFGESNDFIFTDYRGLTVHQITSVRNKLRSQETEFKVLKNRFAKIAFNQLDYNDLGDTLFGPTAVAMCKAESGPIVKALFDFTKDTPLKIKGGLIAGKLLSAAQMDAYSRLPGRLELLSSLMRTMQAPLQNFVYVLNGVTTKLVRTLQAVADKKAAS
ncbi:MAG: 50S ribosomal protein L10 [Spirochaetales bacterium]|nr:MAG: 50S ribosomal protein L10 [Spirochaetales bacterium]